jgi:hypothetical protein
VTDSSQPMRGTRIGVMPPTISPDSPNQRRYKFRDPARGVSGDRAAELEHLRAQLDRQASYPAEDSQPWRGVTVPDVRPAPQARCGQCGHLKWSIACQDAHDGGDP